MKQVNRIQSKINMQKPVNTTPFSLKR